MRKLFFVLALLCTIAAQGQQLFTAPTPFWQGVPTGAPSSQGARVRFDVVAGRWYSWTGSVWTALPWGIATLAGNSAPAYTPGVAQSPFVIVLGTGNLYQYTGPTATDWVCRNCSTDAQTLNWNGSNGELSISGGNTVDLDGRYLTAEVDGSVANEIQTLSLSGRNLTLSSANTVTLPNDLQTLSLSGQSISLSQSGGTVTLPIIDIVAGADISVDISGGVATVSSIGGGGDGNGIYSGSGTVPDGTEASVGDKGAIEFGGDDPEKIALTWRDAASGISHVVSVGSAGLDFRAEYDDGSNPTQSVVFQANSGTATFGSDKSALEFNTKGGTVLFSAPDVSLVFDDTGAAPELKINDERAVPNGLVYSGDYSTTILTNARSIPDVGTVQKLTGSGTTVTGATSALANAAAVTAGVPVGDPYRWDDGTAIHLMFVR